MNYQAVEFLLKRAPVFLRLFYRSRIGYHHIAEVSRKRGRRYEPIRSITHPEGQDIGEAVLATILKIQLPDGLIICDEQPHC